MSKQALAALVLAAASSSCTLVELDSREHPSGFEISGVVDGHVAFGFNDERTPLRLELFDGRSSGALAELVVWKLFRLEIGLAGLDIGIGPLDAGLGVLFYEPSLPSYPSAAPQPPASSPESRNDTTPKP